MLSRCASVVLAAILAASVGLKLATLHRRPDTASDRIAAVAGALSQHGYTPSLDQARSDPASIGGRSGDCSLRIYFLSPQGWTRDVIRALRGPDRRVVFVFKGEQYDEQPTLRTWLDYEWWQLNSVAGRKLPSHLVLGVSSSTACPSSPLPWSELSQVEG